MILRDAAICLIVLFMMTTSCNSGERAVSARMAATHASIESIRTACDTYKFDTENFPPDARALFVNPGVSNWQGPYLRIPSNRDQVLLDHWGHEFMFSPTGNVTIVSAGPNGKFGDKDDIDGRTPLKPAGGCSAGF